MPVSNPAPGRLIRAEGDESEESDDSGPRAREKKVTIPARGKPDSGDSCLRTGSITDSAESQKVTESRKVTKVVILVIHAIPSLSRVLRSSTLFRPESSESGSGCPKAA